MPQIKNPLSIVPGLDQVIPPAAWRSLLTAVMANLTDPAAQPATERKVIFEFALMANPERDRAGCQVTRFDALLAGPELALQKLAAEIEERTDHELAITLTTTGVAELPDSEPAAESDIDPPGVLEILDGDLDMVWRRLFRRAMRDAVDPEKETKKPRKVRIDLGFLPDGRDCVVRIIAARSKFGQVTLPEPRVAQIIRDNGQLRLVFEEANS